MLAQMICVDRRYQRMNCFNVREIQALLKQKFFTELQHDLLITKKTPIYLLKLRSFPSLATDTPSLLPLFEWGIVSTPSTSQFSNSSILHASSSLHFFNPFFRLLTLEVSLFTFLYNSFSLFLNAMQKGFIVFIKQVFTPNAYSFYQNNGKNLFYQL